MTTLAMTEPTAAESEAYFNTLPLLDRQNDPAIRITLLSDTPDAPGDDNVAKINKDAPAIVAFADGVSAKNREAVLLGVEFAETVAHEKHDINKEPVDWLKAYADALRIAGWLTLGGHEYADYTTNSQALTMDSVVLDLIGAVAGPNAATVISLLNVVLDKMQKNKPLMQLFERNAKKGNISSFRIMPCVESSQGIPITYLVAVQCKYSSEQGGVLFWKWSVSKLSIKHLARGVQFAEDTHKRNKDKILAFLKSDVDSFFEALKK